MRRPRSRSIAVVVPLLIMLGVVFTACSSPPEKQTLQKYFSAARMRDNLTLGNIATVSLNPDKEGAVQTFSITQVGEEVRQPLRVKELTKAFDDARAAEEEFTKRKKEYQDANLAAIDRVLTAEREQKPLRGKDLEVQAEWTKWRDETSSHAKTTAEARAALSNSRGIAEISVFDARNQVDVSQYDGDLVTKDVTIQAKFRLPDGKTEDRTMVVRMQRAELKGPEGQEVNGRWIITSLGEGS